MNSTLLSNNELLVKIKDLALEERKLQAVFLLHLKEVEKRKLHLSLGFSSLFDYVVKDLGFSESSAYRRISAMRVLKSMPDETVKTKIESGALNLSNLSKAYSFMKKTKEQDKNNLNLQVNDQKSSDPSLNQVEILKSIENKSTRDVERHFVTLNPEAMVPIEKVRPITEDKSELKVVLDQEQLNTLDELRYLLSHVNPNMSYKELINYLAESALKKIKHQKQVSKGTSCAKSKTARARYIPAMVKRVVYQRDKGCCTYKDAKSGKKCGSKYQVQVDHIQPFAFGGDNDVQNLRLLCAQHNRLRNHNHSMNF